MFAGHTGDDGCCPSIDRTCEQISFFSSTDAAHTRAARNPDITGAVTDQHHALVLGIAEFGALMGPIATQRPIGT